jgi:hypothetical protein
MDLSKDRDAQREQRILSAIRDGLFADARLGEHTREDCKLVERQAIVQGEGITSDSPSTAPNALTSR